MPGIVGIISQKPAEHCQRLVNSMVASMEHESFHTSGTYFAPERGIYAGWVALENSFAADQFFFNEQRDIALIFSGECFADAHTKTELRRKGHQLGSSSAGWLIHLYEEEGEKFFEKLNGLFSGLLIDKRNGKAFLFNDRYGLERVYWHQTNDAFYFASEAKALLRVLPELREFDADAVTQFFALGCTLDWRTLFRGIELMPGASLWTFEDRNCRKVTYFSPEQWEHQGGLSIGEFETQFQETFKRILPRYFEAESRVGISLTAGLDTRMIMACRPALKQNPICYTFSGERRDTLDAILAGRIARVCGMEHHALRVAPDFFSNFASFTDRTIYMTDGYFGALGAHEIYFNRQGREFSPIRLTGNYGSEVLRGTSTFKPIGLSSRLFNPALSRAVGAAQRFAGGEAHPITFAAFREIPWNLFGSLAAGRSQVSFRTPYLDNEIVALAYRAPEAIRHSAHPALRLVQSASPVLSEIPTDRGFVGEKSNPMVWLRRCFAEVTFKLDYYNNEGLPDFLSPLDSTFQRAGFGLGALGLHKFLHYRSWFRRELSPYVTERLNDVSTQQNQFWNPEFLKRVAEEHIQGRKNYVMEINAILTIEAIERLMFRDLPREEEMTGSIPVLTPTPVGENP